MSPSPNQFRIAVLLCDTPNASILAAQGDYGEIFRTLFRKSLEAIQSKSTSESDVSFVVDKFDVRNKLEYPEDVDLYDAVLLTGSAASAYEDIPWINRLVNYVKYVVEEKPKIRLIGICFGHQVIARAMGGECVPNGGRWEAGTMAIQLTKVGRKLFGVPELNIQQMHRDHVPAVPPSFHLLGATSITPNQGMVKLYPGAAPESLSPADVQVFCVQGHPEFDQFIVDEIVKVRASSGAMSREVVDDVAQRRDWRNDGVGVIGRTLWEILRASRG